MDKHLEVQIKNYGNKLGDEMIVRLNVFNMYRKNIKENNHRKQPLIVQSGFVHNDTLTIEVPKQYNVEHLPKPKVIENEFGLYKIEVVKLNDKLIKYTRKLQLLDGVFSVDKYQEYYEFIHSVRVNDNRKISLKKE